MQNRQTKRKPVNFSTPKGLRLLAQGCEVGQSGSDRATLGTNAKKSFSLSSRGGRIALLAISQRSIIVSRKHIPQNRRTRTPFPTSLKTFSDQMRVKRYERGLLQWELAEQVGVPVKHLQKWERGLRTPNESEQAKLVAILGLDLILEIPHPNS
jgi:ribosome-binding protein aMBF1 (putative translation factor)